MLFGYAKLVCQSKAVHKYLHLYTFMPICMHMNKTSILILKGTYS